MDVFDAPEDIWELADEEDHNHTQLWTTAEDLKEWSNSTFKRTQGYLTRPAKQRRDGPILRMLRVCRSPVELANT